MTLSAMIFGHLWSFNILKYRCTSTLKDAKEIHVTHMNIRGTHHSAMHAVLPHFTFCFVVEKNYSMDNTNADQMHASIRNNIKIILIS